PGLEHLVLLAGDPGHLLDGFELLARDHVKLAQHALGLGAEHGVELAPHALGDPGGVVHQPRDLVKESAARLRHRSPPRLSPGLTMARTARTRKRPFCPRLGRLRQSALDLAPLMVPMRPPTI